MHFNSQTEQIWLLYLKLSLSRANIVGFTQFLAESISYSKLILEIPAYIV